MDRVFVTGLARDGRGRDHAGRRTGQRGADRKTPRGRRRHHPAVRLHDVELTLEPLAGECMLQLAEIEADHRLQITVERSGG
jgi:hypothetical protein